MAQARFSFKITILILFCVLTFGLSAVVLYVNYNRNSEATILAADNLLEQSSARMIAAIDRLIEPLITVVDTVVQLPPMDAAAGELEHPLAPIMIENLERFPQIASLYVGNGRGDFYRIMAFQGERELARASVKAPANAMLATQRIVTKPDGTRDAIWRFFDSDSAIAGTNVDAATAYDPRQRPWYIAASDTPTRIVTDYYAFASVPSVGLTIARRWGDENNNVFAADLTMSSISHYLAGIRDAHIAGTGMAEIALFHLDGRLLAHSDVANFERALNASANPRIPAIGEVGSGVLPTIVARYSTTSEQRLRVVDAKGVDWLARVMPAPEAFGTGTYLALAVPANEFLGPLARTAQQTLLISLIAVLAFLPLVYLMANAISAPLDRLRAEVATLHTFDGPRTTTVRSAIAEIQDLAQALATAKFLLGVFGKYVPKNLVQQFVDTKTEPVLGGERRPVSVFFSDVRDFTTLSEELPPEQLMLLTSEYLEGLVEIILENRGTVDKFVGDQIMAYWNAPVRNPLHQQDGCITVLRCRDWSNRMNDEWEAKGRPILYTRFAVHAGEAVVGNVGSSDRMDYTVVGNTINLGSRLEGLNKIYGTQVLISEPVAAAVRGRFTMRPVDMVLPKGAVHPLAIYELLGAHPDWADAPSDIVTDRKAVTMCERWSSVYEHYLRRDWSALLDALDAFTAEFGEDTLANVYYQRVANFTIEPPPDDWDGIIRYSEK